MTAVSADEKSRHLTPDNNASCQRVDSPPTYPESTTKSIDIQAIAMSLDTARLFAIRHIATVATLLVGASLLWGCSSERPGRPVPVEYNLYVKHQGGGGAISVIDMQTDTTSYQIPAAGFHQFATSADGKYLAWYVGSSIARVTLMESSTLVPVQSDPIEASVTSLAFVSNPERLLVNAYDSVFVLDVPSLTRDTIWHHNTLSLSITNPTLNHLGLLVMSLFDDPVYESDLPFLARLNPRTGELSDSVVLRCDGTPVNWCCGGASLSLDGTRLYWAISPLGSSEPMLTAFNVADGSCLYMTPLQIPNADVAVTADGCEVWVTQGSIPANFPVPPDLGHILIFDASTGTPIDTIRTLGMRIDKPELPLNLSQLVMHPELPKAYVTSDATTPSILVFDTESRLLTDTFHTGRILTLNIAPK